MRVSANTSSHLSRRQFLQVGGLGAFALALQNAAGTSTPGPVRLRNMQPKIGTVSTPKYDSHIFRPVWNFKVHDEKTGNHCRVQVDAFLERIRNPKDIEGAHIRVFGQIGPQGESRDLTFTIRNGRPLLQGNKGQRPTRQDLALANQALEFLRTYQPTHEEALDIYDALTGHNGIPAGNNLALFLRPPKPVA